MNPWNVNNEFKHLELHELYEEQAKRTLPFAVCALNLTGDLNIGMMIRSAVLTGAERFFVFGRRCYDRRSTVGAHHYIDVVRVNGIDEEGEYDVNKFHQMLKLYDYTPVFVEQGGEPLRAHEPQEKFCYVFGNEGTGIPEQLMTGGQKISIDQRGILRSFNVSASASIVLHHVMENL